MCVVPLWGGFSGVGVQGAKLLRQDTTILGDSGNSSHIHAHICHVPYMYKLSPKREVSSVLYLGVFSPRPPRPPPPPHTVYIHCGNTAPLCRRAGGRAAGTAGVCRKRRDVFGRLFDVLWRKTGYCQVVFCGRGPRGRCDRGAVTALVRGTRRHTGAGAAGTRGRAPRHAAHAAHAACRGVPRRRPDPRTVPLCPTWPHEYSAPAWWAARRHLAMGISRHWAFSRHWASPAIGPPPPTRPPPLAPTVEPPRGGTVSPLVRGRVA